MNNFRGWTYNKSATGRSCTTAVLSISIGWFLLNFSTLFYEKLLAVQINDALQTLQKCDCSIATVHACTTTSAHSHDVSCSQINA